MCGSKPSAPPPVQYKTSDGQAFSTALEAQEYERKKRLAAALGYEGDVPAQTPGAYGLGAPSYGYLGGLDLSGVVGATKDPFQTWLEADPARQQDWKAFYDTGLTAGDYIAEKRRREEETRRETAIGEGRAAIDAAFTQYDDPYFKGIQKTFLDYYTPQLDTQFGKAKDQLTYDLARKGKLNSSSGITRLADLTKELETQRGAIASKADDAVRGQRADVLDTKDQLYAFNSTAADAGAVTERVGGITDRLGSYAPQLEPLGQVFYDYITPVAGTVANGLSAEARGYPGLRTGLFNPGYGSGKSKSLNIVGSR